MDENGHFKFSTGVIAYPVFFVLIIWSVLSFEVRFSVNFNEFGIYPRTFDGLRGVLLSPFIHNGIKHLYHNTVPVLVLTMAMFYFYRKIAWKVILLGIVISGFLTWCIGRPSYHIGASGLIYVLVSFTFFKGVFAKHYRLIALSLLVVFLYGSMVWYIVPIKEGVSWEGHLSGLVTGLIFALFFKKQIAKPKTFVWEQEDYNEDDDPFLKHFDKDGNFIETLDDDQEDLPSINYTYKENKK
ncbi:rhomboid family intramembrane serine protease [Seonamhaeicola sp. ML3]|uniref:rhomboid family intramembrane serine protease n=1 Tax=Seonamhaeicola sp. ML3 TaxID=2937786 RepID=UPI00200CEF92|nr:rhomboid family intramembrane serine protease [Seonamhaeicola sp. ML3]